MRAQPWFERRVVGGLMSYWIYQHLGNLSPDDLATDELLGRVCAADDAAPLLRDFAREAAHQSDRSRFSFRRDLGRVRLVVLDARCGRELEPGRRRIMPDAEWAWVAEQLAGDYDHLLLASSIPFVVGHGLHDLEAWNERVCDGAWGARAARWAERYRQWANLGHWAAFERSFGQLVGLLDDLVAGRLGPVPRSVVALSGELSQSERTHALQALRGGRARVCVATDVAARGIDLPDLGLVVHADLPKRRETLLHRSGRTGRAGGDRDAARERLIIRPRRRGAADGIRHRQRRSRGTAAGEEERAGVRPGLGGRRVRRGDRHRRQGRRRVDRAHLEKRELVVDRAGGVGDGEPAVLVARALAELQGAHLVDQAA
ncbi:MAG: C-terminal helicase domain-containing protein [Actinobacteria bacterium]|nr:C-terminal helicase domain-containing protein [Actinomycetota bacterium]